MKQRMICLVLGALALGAASVANARVDFSVNLGPPPVVYQPDPYHVAPPVVYIGGGLGRATTTTSTTIEAINDHRHH